MKQFKGLVAAAYTPMHEDESLALEKIGELLEYSVRAKFAGLFAVGSTGEFCSLTMEERKAVAAEYIRCSQGRIPVIVNVGSTCAADSIALAEHAVQCGADAICVIAPYYFVPANVRDLADFVEKIAPACFGKPLFIYHAPGLTGFSQSMVDFLKIMLDEVPNFAGMKFTSDNLYEYQRCANLSDRLQILFGKDEMLLGALAMGARAGVGTTFNYLPRLYNQVIDAFDAGKMDEARKFMTLAQQAVAISAHYGLPAIKTFMKFAGIDIGPMRSPVNRLTPAQEKAFHSELETTGLLPFIGC